MNTFGRSILAGATLAFGFTTAAIAADITGAGATFPYPIYAKWATAYKKETGIGLNYQSIGSGGGIKQIYAKTVDFGASDKPLKEEVLRKHGLLQFPTVMGGVVPVVHLKGVKPGELKLNSTVLADIYLGKIKKWNNAAIAKLNKGVHLPDHAITVVHRSDGSGTTFIYTNYLSKVSPEWKTKVGNDASVAWPTGVGGKGNEGVASYVQRINGSIGYVEYAYALQNKMTYALLKNRAGHYIKPRQKTFQAAAAGADWAHAPGMYQILTDEPGRYSWPITGATFILMYKVQTNPANAKHVLQFFDWAYAHGDGMAAELDYIPMPNKVVKLIKAEWKQIKDTNGNPVYK
ncbi:MAG TPA: phosphate ABC transporter substrate-binding protein PstS [Betaproteobacteria bacterium]|nr:phosphate ABC transporter substrate-binding protein PstS [Betaproteobacteria bacterium]